MTRDPFGEQGSPPRPLDYRPRSVRDERRVAGRAGWVFLGLAVQVLATAGLAVCLNRVSAGVALAAWAAVVAVAYAAASAVDAIAHRGRGWPCTVGVTVGLLLTGGMCGLFYSVCGNPFGSHF